MAVRQYIGARYVPKFYENSENSLSCEWESGASYEALEIVTYLNSSYTSKKPVPATVGNPASNSEYWALTGAYNSQVEDYRRAVERINNRYISTTTAMLSDENISAGNLILTGGYKTENDGGNALFIIKETEPDGYHLTLNNGLYAELLIKNDYGKYLMKLYEKSQGKGRVLVKKNGI